MKWLNFYRIMVVLIGLIIVLSIAVALVRSETTSDATVTITIADYKYCYQPRPELGYVIKIKQNSESSFAMLTKSAVRVGGQGRRGLWIKKDRKSAAQNKTVIKTLSAQRQVQYVAPLFSCNGETEAIIPEIVVRVIAGTKQEELEQICRRLNLHIKRRMMFTEQEYLVDVLGRNADAVLAALIELNQIDSVEWAAPNVITQRKRPEAPISKNNSQGDVYLFDAPQTPSTTGFIPNDEYFPIQWHLHNTGQLGGTPGADINAPEAWEITAGDPNIVVAIIDTGVDSDHPDLVNNLVPGYDFYDNDDLPEPIIGNNHLDAHGTACAGLVAAEGDNDIGVTGVAWKCKVMPVRDGTGSFVSVANGAEGYRWAAANGADILSYSVAFNNPKPILYSAVVDITKPGGIGRNGKGCVVFAATGNEGTFVRYPASNPEVIAVGATDQNDVRWSYSCYGPELDIVAPNGQRGAFVEADPDRWSNEASMILTTDIVGQPGLSSDSAYKYGNELDYGFFGGTSGACPVAAGVAALILSLEPELTNEEVRHFLCRSAKDLGELGRDDYYGWGRVDARAALDMILVKRCDLNNDLIVDEEDLTILNEYIDANDLSGDIAPAAKPDGFVDELDRELMMKYWQKEYPEFGLIAYWRLDETEGNVVYDGINNIKAQLYGEPIWQPTDGMVEGALMLDGIDDFVGTWDIPDLSEGDFSVFLWVKGGAAGQVVVSEYQGVNWLMADASQGYLKTDLAGTMGRSAGQSLVSEVTITDGQWHRVGIAWDGANRILYVDDVAVASDTQTGLEYSGMGLNIGCGPNEESGTFWSGLIDDIRIYNQAITP